MQIIPNCYIIVFRSLILFNLKTAVQWSFIRWINVY